MNIAKLTQFALNSNYPIDQVIFTFGFSGSLFTGTNEPLDSLLPQGSFLEAGSVMPTPSDMLWIGRFSIDEINWTAFDGVINVAGHYVAVSAYLNSAGSWIINSSNTTGNAYTLFLEVTYLARFDQKPFLQPTYPYFDGVPTTGALYNNNTKYPLFDSRSNYMKIANQAILPLTIILNGSYASLTIPHNLGFVPFAFLQMEYNNQMFNLTNATESVGLLPLPVLSYIYMDTTNVYLQTGGLISSGSANVNIHYKIYYDH